jgi:hypothetical protein
MKLFHKGLFYFKNIGTYYLFVSKPFISLIVI